MNKGGCGDGYGCVCVCACAVGVVRTVTGKKRVAERETARGRHSQIAEGTGGGGIRAKGPVVAPANQ